MVEMLLLHVGAVRVAWPQPIGTPAQTGSWVVRQWVQQSRQHDRRPVLVALQRRPTPMAADLWSCLGSAIVHLLLHGDRARLARCGCAEAAAVHASLCMAGAPGGCSARRKRHRALIHLGWSKGAARAGGRQKEEDAVEANSGRRHTVVEAAATSTTTGKSPLDACITSECIRRPTDRLDNGPSTA
jgi:hypothetical protein